MAFPGWAAQLASIFSRLNSFWVKPSHSEGLETVYLLEKRMKFRVLILLVAGLASVSCVEQGETSVEFCLQVDETGRCKEPSKTFAFGSKVYVSCHSPVAFAGTALKGNIYFVTDQEKVYFNYKEFSITPGTQTVHTYIPFDQFGGKGAFYVEFVNEKGEILGGNDLEIIEK